MAVVLPVLRIKRSNGYETSLQVIKSANEHRGLLLLMPKCFRRSLPDQPPCSLASPGSAWKIPVWLRQETPSLLTSSSLLLQGLRGGQVQPQTLGLTHSRLTHALSSPNRSTVTRFTGSDRTMAASRSCTWRRRPSAHSSSQRPLAPTCRRTSPTSISTQKVASPQPGQFRPMPNVPAERLPTLTVA